MQDSLKDRVLEAVDIVDVVGESVALKRQGREFVGLCPFHNDHKPSMTVSPQKQIYKCFSCGAGGDAIKFVQQRQRVDFREALKILAERAGIQTDERRTDAGDARAAARERLRRTMNWAGRHFRDRYQNTDGGNRAHEYALSRGFTEETIANAKLGYAPEAWDDLLNAATRAGIERAQLQAAGLITTNESGRTYDRFRNRLMFPIRDALGRVVAFGGRTLGDDPAKYLNSPETPLFSKSRILYGLHSARDAISRERRVIVVEGYTDALLLQQFGFDNTVATLGTALTGSHIKLLKPLADEVLFCFDSDEAGERAADRAVEVALQQRIKVRVVVMPPGQDPADCVLNSGAASFKETLQSAEDALDFKWRQIAGTFSDDDERGRRMAVEDFLRFLAGVSVHGGVDPLEEGLLVGRLSELLTLAPRRIYELLAQAKTSARRGASSVTPDTPETTSAYEEAVRGLPKSLVSAVESMFGLVLAAPERQPELSDLLTIAANYCEAWNRLQEIMVRLAGDEQASPSRQEVLACCEDAELCDLVSRCCGRVGQTVTGEMVEAARTRFTAERERLRLEHLHEEVRANPDARAFQSLLEVSRRQHGVLPATRRK